MQIGAMASATSGMMRASRLMDVSAAQVAAEVITPSAPSAAAGAPATAAAAADDGLITAMPNLLVAGELFKANAFVARVAQDAYRSVLDLGRPST